MMKVTTVMYLAFQMFLSLKALQYLTLLGMLLRWCREKTTCYVCHEAVGSRKHKCESAFLTLKDQGTLFKPAASIISVCTETEKCFQQMLASTNGRLPQGEGIPDAIAVSVLKGINIQATFQELDGHMSIQWSVTIMFLH